MTGLLGGDGAPLVVLVDATSRAEQDLVEEALRDVGERPATVLPLRGGALAGSLAGADPDTVVTALRVAWAPRRTAEGAETAGQRRWSAAGTFLPRRPPRPFQAGALRRDRERARVVVAEPATVGELTRRWSGTGSLPEFVAHQAALALDRAERNVVGARAKVPRQVAEAIEVSPEFAAEVTALAARLERPEEQVRAEAVTALRRAGGRDGSGGRRAVHRRLPPAALPGLGRAHRHRGAGPPARAQPAATPWSSCPATAPTSTRSCSPTCSPGTTSRATTCWAATTSASGRSDRWPSGPAWSSSGAASATTTSTSWPSASTSPSC